MTKEEIRTIEQSFKQKPEEADKMFRRLYLNRRLSEHSGNITKTSEAIGWTRAGLQKAIKNANKKEQPNA